MEPPRNRTEPHRVLSWRVDWNRTRFNSVPFTFVYSDLLTHGQPAPAPARRRPLQPHCDCREWCHRRGHLRDAFHHRRATWARKSARLSSSRCRGNPDRTLICRGGQLLRSRWGTLYLRSRSVRRPYRIRGWLDVPFRAPGRFRGRSQCLRRLCHLFSAKLGKQN